MAGVAAGAGCVRFGEAGPIADGRSTAEGGVAGIAPGPAQSWAARPMSRMSAMSAPIAA